MEIMDMSRQWQEIKNYDADCIAVDEFKKRLHFLVAKNYGWLAGELFIIEGEIGWGPGNRESGDDYFPDPTDQGQAHMVTFLTTLGMVRKDDEPMSILKDVVMGKLDDPVRMNVSKCLNVPSSKQWPLINHFYDRIMSRDDIYQIGAARIYQSLWLEQKRYALALIGLVRLALGPINRIWVRAETVRRKFSMLRKIVPPLNTGFQSNYASVAL